MRVCVYICVRVCVFPQARLAEIAADNERYSELKAAYDKEKAIRHITVSFKGQLTTVAINEACKGCELLEQARGGILAGLSALIAAGNTVVTEDGPPVDVRTCVCMCL